MKKDNLVVHKEPILIGDNLVKVKDKEGKEHDMHKDLAEKLVKAKAVEYV